MNLAKVKELFHKEICQEVTYTKPHDFLFRDVIFFDLHSTLSKRIGPFLESFFCLFGFEKEI
jgi:hypothetical protein